MPLCTLKWLVLWSPKPSAALGRGIAERSNPPYLPRASFLTSTAMLYLELWVSNVLMKCSVSEKTAPVACPLPQVLFRTTMPLLDFSILVLLVLLHIPLLDAKASCSILSWLPFGSGFDLAYTGSSYCSHMPVPTMPYRSPVFLCSAYQWPWPKSVLPLFEVPGRPFDWP